MPSRADWRVIFKGIAARATRMGIAVKFCSKINSRAGT
jgi:hypothetical protein